MPILRVQYGLTRNTGEPSDTSLNVHHVQAVGAWEADVGLLVSAFNDFWLAGGPAVELRQILSPKVNGREVAVYNLDEPTPREPIYFETGSAPVGFGSGLPAEVSIVASQQALVTPGQNRQRFRGRMYLGPLNTGVLTAGGSTEPVRPSVVAIALIADALGRLLADISAIPAFTWVIYSAGARDNTDGTIPYEDRPILAPIASAITGGYVDNAFDTQRSRGVEDTVRTPWPTL